MSRAWLGLSVENDLLLVAPGDDIMRGVMCAVSVAAPAELPAAVEVWRAANVARGKPPSPQRERRVRQKLEDPDAVVVLVRAESQVAGMALAEPGLADDGAGAVVPGWGHVSMVFVHPDRWGDGLGTALLRQLHQVGQERRHWTRTSLWTGQSNVRARRLYASCGYQPTGRVAALPTGEQIVQLQRSSLPE